MIIRLLVNEIIVGGTIDILAQTLVCVLEKDEVGDHSVFTVKSSVHDILKYTYRGTWNIGTEKII